jgi:chemotaxis protein histidine kinase CheA/CheY-like chemotaxis protein
MRYDIPVNFDTFYYNHLLEKIRVNGSGKYQSDSLELLNKFLDYLLQDNEAFASIENLVNFQSTSDLSIFFSDILEHIREIEPKLALNKADNYAKDFLELFEVLLTDEEWRSFVESDSIAASAGAGQPLPTEEEKINIQEYCRYRMKEKVTSYLRMLPSEKRQMFKNYLNASISNPELVEILKSKISDTSVSEFSNLHSALIDPTKENGHIDVYIDSFENRLSKWIQIFERIVTKFEAEISDTLQQEKEKIEIPGAAVEVPPLEQQFETKAEEDVPRGKESPPKSGEDLEELVEQVEDLKKIRKKSGILGEEEIQRRQLLQDYILGEIEESRNSISFSLENIRSKGVNQESRDVILNSLKDLKNLGQIHNYAGIELFAKNLINIFNKIFEENKPISGDSQTNLNKIFELLPNYIENSLKEDNLESVTSITKELSEFTKSFVGDELLSIEQKEDLSGTFQDIIARRSKVLKAKLTEKPLAEIGESELQSISTTLNNVIFWSDMLKLKPAVICLEYLKELLLTSKRTELNYQNMMPIESCLELMSTKFATAPAERWQEISDGLSELIASLGQVTVQEAEVAFWDVVRRKSVLMSRTFHSQEPEYPVNFLDDVRRFFLHLASNTRLMNKNDLTQLSETICEKLFSFITDSEEITNEQRQEINIQFDNFPEDSLQLEQWLNRFSNMLHGTELPTIETEEEVEISEVTESETEESDIIERSEEQEIMDAEINQAFIGESQSHLQKLGEQLAIVDKDFSKQEPWQEIELTLHSLSSATHIMDRKDLSGIIEPVRDIVEKIRTENIRLTQNILDGLKNAIDILKLQIGYPDFDSEQIKNQLQDLLAEVSPEQAKKISDATLETPKEKETVQEESTAFLELREKDAEILEIFREEVAINFEAVDKTLDKLEKYDYDKSLLQKIDRPIHEISSAAKMLGLNEIGDLSTKLEQAIEVILKNDFTEIEAAVTGIRRSMNCIKELGMAGRVDQEEYENVMGIVNSILERKSLNNQSTNSEVLTKPETTPKTKIDEAEEQESPQFQKIFLQDSLESVEEINNLLLKLEKTPANEQLQLELMRTLHTLKGSAAMAYANKIETLAHLTEEYIEKNFKEKGMLEPSVFDLIFKILDEIKYILQSMQKDNEEKKHDFDELLKKLHQELGLVEKEEFAPEPEVAEELESVEESAAQEPSESKDTYIRLDLGQMNRLLNLASELVIGHTQFKNQLDLLKLVTPELETDLRTLRETRDNLILLISQERELQSNLEPIDAVDPGLKEGIRNQLQNIEKILTKFQNLHEEVDKLAHSIKDSSKTYDENLVKLNKLSNTLLDEIIQARLVPINILFQRFRRPVRDMAHQANKKINLKIQGEDTELDRTLVEELYNPLLHIIRNAIDHGIESAAERKEIHKQVEGTINIRANRNRNQVTIEIQDDGKGIDLNLIKKTAEEKELVAKDDLENMADQDLFEILFLPGFTTISEATKVSGRGVGLDAVKVQIEKLKGNIRMYSEPGKGTTIVIRVPVSLSVIQTMLVAVDENIYSIPLTQVEETLDISEDEVLTDDEGHYILYYGQRISVAMLSNLLKIQQEDPDRILFENKNPCIIISDHGKRVAIVVDKIIRREEVLIKSLGTSLRRLKYILGGSIMSDGRVVLVLDIPEIVLDITKAPREHPGPFGPPETITARISAEGGGEKIAKGRKSIRDRRPNILIVDDSLSIRKYLSGLLEEQGYKTDLARNGYEALEYLKTREFDLIITDLEMPKLSGYELIESLRLDEKYADLPIIVLTGRAGENFRNLTTQLGADAYIIKPFKDKDLFVEIEKFIEVVK